MFLFLQLFQGFIGGEHLVDFGSILGGSSSDPCNGYLMDHNEDS